MRGEPKRLEVTKRLCNYFLIIISTKSFSFLQDMISALKGALSGSLETVILGLMKSTAQYDASEIKASIKVRHSAHSHIPVSTTGLNYIPYLP